MKKYIILFLMAVLYLNVNAEMLPSSELQNAVLPMGSAVTPSDSYLDSQKRSMASSNESLISASSQSMSSPRARWWDDGGLATDGESNANLVGGSVEGATVPIILSMVLLYFFYSKTQSKKNRTKQ